MQHNMTFVPRRFTKKEAEAIVGTLSSPSKMPCHGYSIPAKNCHVGSHLRDLANSVCSKCYALKGRYVFPNVQAAMQRRLASIDDPRWVPAMAALIASTKDTHFRWHDSGDVQSVAHLTRIAQVAELTPNVMHWLPTREYNIVESYLDIYGEFPANLVVRVSAHYVDSAAPKRFANTSSVHRHLQPIGFACRAPSQGNQCGDCRACWDKAIGNVSYLEH